MTDKFVQSVYNSREKHFYSSLTQYIKLFYIPIARFKNKQYGKRNAQEYDLDRGKLNTFNL